MTNNDDPRKAWKIAFWSGMVFTAVFAFLTLLEPARSAEVNWCDLENSVPLEVVAAKHDKTVVFQGEDQVKRFIAAMGLLSGKLSKGDAEIWGEGEYAVFQVNPGTRSYHFMFFDQNGCSHSHLYAIDWAIAAKGYAERWYPKFGSTTIEEFILGKTLAPVGEDS